MPDGRLPLVANFGDLSYNKFLEREKRGTTAFERGAMQGLGEAGTSTLKVLDYLVPGQALTRFAEQSEREMQEYYDPYGTMGEAGRAVGRIAGEIAQAAPLAAPLAKAAKAVPVAGPAIGRALESGSRLQRALGAAAVGAPIDIAQGLKYETPTFLPESTGRLGSVVEGVLTSGIIGGALPSAARPVNIRRPRTPEPIIVDQRLVRVPPEPGAAGPVGAAIPEAQAVLPAGQRALPGGRRALPAGVVPEAPVEPVVAPAAPRPKAPTVSPEQAARDAAEVGDNFHIGGARENKAIFERPLDPDEVYEVGSRSPLGELTEVSYTRIPPIYTLKWEVRRVRLRDGRVIGGATSNLTPERIALFEEATDLRPIAKQSSRPDAAKEAKKRLKELKAMGITPLRDDDLWDLNRAKNRIEDGEKLNDELALPEDVPKILQAMSDPATPVWSRRDYYGEAPAKYADEDVPEAPRAAVSAEAEAERQAIAEADTDNFRQYMEMPLEELRTKFPRILNPKRMSPDQLDASRAYYLRLRDEAMDRAGVFALEGEATSFTETFGTSRRVGYSRAKKLYGTREEARKIKGLSEEQLGWLEERNISPEDYPKMRDAASRLLDIDKILTRIDDAVRERESFDFGPRAGFASQQVIGTLGGGVVGSTAGAATGGTPEERRRRALVGFAIGAGAGAGAMALARRGGRAPSGSTESIRNYNTSIRIGEQAAPERWLTPLQRAYTSIVSETYPMVAAGRAAAGEAGGQAVLEQVARSQGAGGAARQYIDDNVRPVLQAASDKWDDIRALLKARRDLNIREVGGGYRVTDPSGRVIAEGITPAQLREMGALPEGYTATPVRGAPKSSFTDDEVRQAIADAERDPAVKAAADRINGIYRDLLRLKYEAGILTEDEYRRILQSEDFYDPFVREFGAERAVAGAGGKKFSISSKGVSQMDRMAEAIAETADPLEVLVSSINRTMNVVGRQRVANVLFELADIGELPFIRVVDGPVTPESRRFRQLRNGVPVTYEVTDPDIYEAMAGIAQGPSGGNFFVNFARKLKEIKQFGITQNPAFALFNLARDISASGIQRPDLARAVTEGAVGAAAGGAVGGLTADEGEALSGVLRGIAFGAGAGMYARPVAEVMGAMKNIVRNDDIFKEFLRQGGSTEGFFVRSPSDARKVLQSLERSGVSLSDVVSPKRWFDTMQTLGSAAEQATRLATYKQMIERGATREAAVLAAQDRTLRFANVGKDTKGIAKVTAFWNAKIQGWDKLFRMLKDPRTTTAAAAMITAPSLALWSVNKDNPEYWQRPLWERNLFWLVPKADGSGFYRVPKPFEIGYIFASLPERLLDFAAQSGAEIPGLSDLTSASPEMAEPGRQLRRAVGEMAGSTAGGTLPVPDIASLPAQLVSNYDLFRGRRIVTQPNVPAPQQVTPESSALARVLADQFGISPQKTDFAIRAQFGTMGQFASERLDAAIRAAGGEASEPRAKGQGVLPRRFVTQQYSQTETESQARDILAGLDRTYAGYRVEQKTLDPDRIAEYERQNKSDIRAYNFLGDQRRALDDIASERRAVTRNVAITPERKEELLSDLRKRGEQVSRSVLKYRITP